MKLAAAERELAQMQELKDEIERLKALLREKDKKKPRQEEASRAMARRVDDSEVLKIHNPATTDLVGGDWNHGIL